MVSNVIDNIFSTDCIRSCAKKMVNRCLAGDTNFALHEALLPDAADFVLDVIREQYPDLNVPYHSRWRHFEVGNQAQLLEYEKVLSDRDEREKARLGLDMIIPSILVDAGAGPDWVYKSENSLALGRSEGLGLASLDAFLSGAFSQKAMAATDASGLQSMTREKFSTLFKVSQDNPMLGVDGRVALLQSLAVTLDTKPDFFPNKRPGDLVDYILSRFGHRVSAQQILHIIVQAFGDIWPGRLVHQGVNLGDTWQYPPFGTDVEGYIPFHKLSQWMSYSVVETLERNGFDVYGVENLTGLAEYRNGGFMVDFGLLTLRDESVAVKKWAPSSEIIVEWRALTIYLLDKLAELIQQKLQRDATQFPLAKVLEGGTWAAGRKLAAKKRENAEPPIQIESDGTVF